MFRVLILLLIFSNLFYSAKAELVSKFALGFPFTENGVLQRQENIKIFGTAEANSKVEINLATKKAIAKANQDGNWFVTLDPVPAGGPYQLKAINNSQTIEIKKVYIGDLWLAAGQSNLVWFVDSATNAQKNIDEAINYKNKIFFFDSKSRPSETVISPFTPSAKNWTNTDIDVVKTFGAVPYAFAREIYQDQKVPIGIIQAAVSNTQIQAHMSEESLVGYKDLEKFKTTALDDKIIWYQLAFETRNQPKDFTLCIGDAHYQKDLTIYFNDRKVDKDSVQTHCNKFEASVLNPINKIQIRVYPTKIKYTTLDELAKGLSKSKIMTNDQELTLNNWMILPEISANTPSSNFNTKINPMTMYPIKGIIWYQGESNVDDYSAYKELFTSLVKDWRKRWQKELPFITVQLHNFKTDHPENLLKFRTAQAELSKEINKIYIIDAFDLGDPDLNVHPKNKDAVGKRLAEMAKKEIYAK